MYRKGIAGQQVFFSLVNATSGAALTGASVTARASLGTSTQITASGTINEQGSGQYYFQPTSSEINADFVGYLFTATNAIPVNANIVTVTINVHSSMDMGIGALPAVAAGGVNGLLINGTNTAATVQIGGLTSTGAVTVTGAVNLNGGLTSTAVSIGSLTSTGAVTFTGAFNLNGGLVSTGANISAITSSGLWTIGGITSTFTGNLTGSIGSLGATAKSDVNAEVVDVIRVDTTAESTGVPTATATLDRKIAWLQTLARNKITQTSTGQTLYDDAGGVIDEADMTDDGVTFTRTEWT